jgi:hypothetical protein
MKRLWVLISVLKTQSSRTLLLLGAVLIVVGFDGCRSYEQAPYYQPACCAPCTPCQPAATTYAPPVRAGAAPCCCQ